MQNIGLKDDMIMQTLSFKKHEGVANNPTGQWSSPPWWSSDGSEPVYGESGDKFMPCVEQGIDKGPEMGNVSHFIIFPGHNKSQANGEKPPELQAAISMQAAPPGHIELGFDQQAIGAKYLYGNECYGVVSTCGPPVKGRMMLPLSLTKDDGPIYVNPKQYHGIIRRRLSRAKEESNKTILRSRKPYLHLSRHLHAMRRQRGCGGRFVNTKKPHAGKGGGNVMDEIAEKSDLPGSEATRMFLRREPNPFSINHLSSSTHSQARNSGHGSYFMPGMWAAAAADNGCDLNF